MIYVSVWVNAKLCFVFRIYVSNRCWKWICHRVGGNRCSAHLQLYYLCMLSYTERIKNCPCLFAKTYVCPGEMKFEICKLTLMCLNCMEGSYTRTRQYNVLLRDKFCPRFRQVRVKYLGILKAIFFLISHPRFPSYLGHDSFSCFILLTHKGSHREVYQEFQPSWHFLQVMPRVVQTTGSVHPPAYTVQLLTLHQHRVNNQYRMANQI